MNPCPCGYHGQARCHCTPDQVTRYRNRISGPLLDRVDMQIGMRAVPVEDLQRANEGEGSEEIQARVQAARDRMLARQGKPNAMLGVRELEAHCALAAEAATLLHDAMRKLGLSARSYHRTLKVARSIADLAEAERIAALHIAEALGYRRKSNA
jgi:magnesium chelatase family protein